MTREEIVRVLEAHGAANAARDASAFARLYTPDAIVISPILGSVSGRAAIERGFETLAHVFGDPQITLETRVIDGDTAMEVQTIRAIHAGEIFGVPASHKPVHFTIVYVFQFRDGLIAHDRRLYDFTSVLVQLGVLRAKPA